VNKIVLKPKVIHRWKTISETFFLYLNYQG